MRIFVIIVAIIILGYLAFLALKTELEQFALIAMSSDRFQECLQTIRLSYPEVGRGDLTISPAHLNNDTTIDTIVELVHESTCGSAGCVFELCVSDDGRYKHHEFGFVAETITAQDALSNGMHDIIINNDSSLRLVWDGRQYQYNPF